MTKQIIESDKPKEYYFSLCLKMSQQKRLNQRERIFIELFANKELPCYYFTKQMTPSILQYNARIFKLREQGFIIKCDYHMIGNEKHSVYTLDKTHFVVEVQRKKLFGLF